MKSSNVRNLSIISLMLIISLLFSIVSAQGTPRGDTNSTNPMIIYSESWNPFYNGGGGNATITNIKNTTIKNNILAPDKPYRVITKNLTLQIGNVELRNNGTVFKNCLLEGDFNGDGEYHIMSFQLLNQTQERNYDDGTEQVNLSYQEYPELPNVICKFVTDGTGTLSDEKDRARYGNDLRVTRFDEKSIILIIIFLVLLALIIIVWKIKRK